MKNEARNEMLAEAEAKFAEARLAWDSAKTKKARREAGADLEFWGNKAAFLAHARCEA